MRLRLMVPLPVGHRHEPACLIVGGSNHGKKTAQIKKGSAREPVFLMVGGEGFEPPTTSV